MIKDKHERAVTSVRTTGGNTDENPTMISFYHGLSPKTLSFNFGSLMAMDELTTNIDNYIS